MPMPMPIAQSECQTNAPAETGLQTDHARYVKCIQISKRIRWDIDTDVIKGRSFDHGRKFLPDSLSLVDRLATLSLEEQRLLSQIQGRTYANMFGMVERFIGAKMLDVGRAHGLGDQVALEAVVRFVDEELKHQALFRRVDDMIGIGMPAGYAFVSDPDAVARAVLRASTWAVLGLTLHIELFTQVHYRQSIEPLAELSPIFKDIFHFHWMEESQHAIVDEMEWKREDAALSDDDRDHAVDDLIGLVSAVDSIVQAQAKADADYFLRVCGRKLNNSDQTDLGLTLLAAYRWQYIVSGLKASRFNTVLSSLLSPSQLDRVGNALKPLLA